jgi:hypothetical protein
MKITKIDDKKTSSNLNPKYELKKPILHKG